RITTRHVIQKSLQVRRRRVPAMCRHLACVDEIVELLRVWRQSMGGGIAASSSENPSCGTADPSGEIVVPDMPHFIEHPDGQVPQKWPGSPDEVAQRGILTVRRAVDNRQESDVRSGGR